LPLLPFQLSDYATDLSSMLSAAAIAIIGQIEAAGFS
jgi:hypothetical protein